MQPPAPAITALPDYASWLNTEQVAKALCVSYTQANAWIVNGIATEGGRVRLQAAKIGGRWRVNPEWVVAFIAATTKASLPKSATLPESAAEGSASASGVMTEAERARRHEAAMGRIRARTARASK